MKHAAVLLAVVVAASPPIGAAPKTPKPDPSRFTLTVSGLIAGSFEGRGPLSSAKRRSKLGTSGEVLAIKLRASSPSLGKLDLDATPDVTARPLFAETGRFDVSNLGAIGTITLGRERSWINAKTGELVVEQCDDRHVKGHLDFRGPCKTSSRRGDCVVHADFDVSRHR